MGMVVIQPYILVSKLKNTKTKVLRCTGYHTSLKTSLTAVQKHIIKYCEKVYERSIKNLFWSIKNSSEILDKLKARDFNATSLSNYDFYTLYTNLPHNLIKVKLIDLIERTFNSKGSPYLACNDRNAFLLQKIAKNSMHCLVKIFVMH